MTNLTPQTGTSDRASRIAWACTLSLLAGVGADRLFFSQPSAEAGIYHEQVHATASTFPFHFDRWLGIDSPVPQSAITMLQPNFILSRSYHEMGQGRNVTLIVVQCKDSRDILGHYPPVCYPSQGWLLDSSTPLDVVVDGQAVNATHYVFDSDRDGSRRELTLDNFMILPIGKTARNMDEVEKMSGDSRLKHFGAAQVQIVYGPGLTESDRTEIFQTFVRQLQPILSAVMKPGKDN